MKILLLASGGDAPGMNYCLFQICKKLKKHELYFCYYGYKGLFENNIKKADLSFLKNQKDIAGVCIKTARFEDFKNDDVQNVAVENVKKHGFDVVIVLGGDGTHKGAVELCQKGVNVVFIPTTVDNDMCYQCQTIGFETAVFATCQYVKNVMTSMESFDRSCVFQVMGRYNDSIAKKSGKILGADLVVTPDNIDDFENFTLKENQKSHVCILQEKMVDIEDFAKKLSNKFQTEFRYAIVGYVQRGTSPTKAEKQICSIYADLACKNILDKNYNIALSVLGDKKSWHKIV